MSEIAKSYYGMGQDPYKASVTHGKDAVVCMKQIIYRRRSDWITMKKNKESASEKQLNTKIEERLSKMEGPGYVFAKRFSKSDYLITFIVVVFCLAFLIVGVYL